MSDLSSKDSSLLVSVVGIDSSTGETNPVNSSAQGELLTKTTITGGDGLYKATVDSLNRLSVNANVNFPEAVYVMPFALDGASPNMNVNGSSTNKNFRYSPAAGTTFYLEKIALTITDKSTLDYNRFGDIGALANGLQINVKSKGTVYTLANLQSNQDIWSFFCESPHENAASYTGFMRIQNRTALDGNFGDYVELKVRDNLTGLNALKSMITAWRVN